MTRRGFLAAGVLGGAALVACSRSTTSPAPAGGATTAEAARPHTGKTVTARLAPGTADIDLGGTRARTLAYNGQVPGPLIRANVGDDIAVTVDNGLDHPTSVHWHGIALRNDMDGASPATPNIGPGSSFTYRFSSPYPGTYWAHPHTGLDTDYGLYVPVIIDDPAEPGRYDAEWIVMLDDWTSGVGTSPEQIFEGLRSKGMGAGSMPGMPGMGGMGSMPGMGGMDSMPECPASVAPEPVICWGATAVTSAIRTTSSTAVSRLRRALSPPSRGSASGSGSSTPARTPPSGSPWPGTG